MGTGQSAPQASFYCHACEQNFQARDNATRCIRCGGGFIEQGDAARRDSEPSAPSHGGIQAERRGRRFHRPFSSNAVIDEDAAENIRATDMGGMTATELLLNLQAFQISEEEHRRAMQAMERARIDNSMEHALPSKAESSPASESAWVSLKSANPNESGSECPICCESFTEGLQTPCGHTFCPSCIGDWLERQNYCPTCLQSLEERPSSSTPVPASKRSHQPESSANEADPREASSRSSGE